MNCFDKDLEIIPSLFVLFLVSFLPTFRIVLPLRSFLCAAVCRASGFMQERFIVWLFICERFITTANLVFINTIHFNNDSLLVYTVIIIFIIIIFSISFGFMLLMV